jgi:hypothetical protein
VSWNWYVSKVTRKPYVEEQVRIRPTPKEAEALVKAGFKDFAALQNAKEANEKKRLATMANLEADLDAQKKRKADELEGERFLREQWQRRARESRAEIDILTDVLDAERRTMDERLAEERRAHAATLARLHLLEQQQGATAGTTRRQAEADAVGLRAIARARGLQADAVGERAIARALALGADQDGLCDEEDADIERG